MYVLVTATADLFRQVKHKLSHRAAIRGSGTYVDEPLHDPDESLSLVVRVHRSSDIGGSAWLWLKATPAPPRIGAWAGSLEPGNRRPYADEARRGHYARVSWDGHAWRGDDGGDAVEAVIRFIDEVLDWTESLPG